jgi:CTP synthase
VRIEYFDAEKLEDPAVLARLDGLLVPHGFGQRGAEGKVQAVRWAREGGIPFLGICFGMQIAVIEFARNAAGLAGANSTEVDPATPHPVIDLLPEQRGVEAKGATMRLGDWPCVLRPGTRAHRAYGQERIAERHRHRYEFNPAYRERLEQAGLVAAGCSPDGRLVEIVEVEDHPWFVAVQFHPEFASTPFRPHPLFVDFVAAALRRGAERA